MSMLSFIPAHIKKSKVEENQSHHAYDCDDKWKNGSVSSIRIRCSFAKFASTGKRPIYLQVENRQEKPKKDDFTKHESTQDHRYQDVFK
jgi:hypothetical protein